MSDSTMREQSKKNWTSSDTTDHLKLGCLQRIADATELMAKEHARLVRERDNYERWYRNKDQEALRLSRRVSALQGVITRMKRKAATA